MIRILASRNHPAHLLELSAGDVGEDLRVALGLVEDNLRRHAGPIRSRTLSPSGGTRYAHVLNRIGSSPDRAGQRRVIAPADVCIVERVRERGMLKAGVNRRVAGLTARGIDHSDLRARGSDATRGAGNPSRVLGRKQRAGGRWR
jgi:hypothetical protein